jgi:hypothetical protein
MEDDRLIQGTEDEQAALDALAERMREDIDVLADHLAGVPYGQLSPVVRETADIITWVWELEEDGIFWADEDDECELGPIRNSAELKATIRGAPARHTRHARLPGLGVDTPGSRQ